MTDALPDAPVLNRVMRGSLCAGCGACETLGEGAVTMGYSADGYLRPRQSGPISAEAERRIAAVCPGVGLTVKPEGRPDHPLWGPYLGIYSGHATDPTLRQMGASGGVLSGLVAYLLGEGLVDRVIQVGADPDLPVGNRTVVVEAPEGIAAAAGSRYAPSSPMARLETYLASDQTFAFVGKPCDVSALRAMEKIDPRVAERIPYKLSFFCAGVPSLDGAREVLKTLGAPEDQVAAFRYRGDGWPGMARATLADGTTREMTYADSWGSILSRHVQFRCKICPDGTGSFADAVCADAWESDERGYPVFEERAGISLAVGRTAKGEEMLSAAQAKGYVVLEPFDVKTLSAIQPGQRTKRHYGFARLAALRVLGKPAPKYSGFHLVANARAAGLKGNLKNFLGTLRRAMLGKL